MLTTSRYKSHTFGARQEKNGVWLREMSGQFSGIDHELSLIENLVMMFQILLVHTEKTSVGHTAELPGCTRAS